MLDLSTLKGICSDAHRSRTCPCNRQICENCLTNAELRMLRSLTAILPTVVEQINEQRQLNRKRSIFSYLKFWSK